MFHSCILKKLDILKKETILFCAVHVLQKSVLNQKLNYPQVIQTCKISDITFMGEILGVQLVTDEMK